MSARKHLDCLTSLRFFAAALIAVGHAGSQAGFGMFRFDLFNPGNGVSFFYVLSGFILAYTYSNMDEKRDYKKYIVARIARIWPLHLVTLAFCVYEFGPLPSVSDGGQLVKLTANAFLLHAWVPLPDWYYSYNWVSWSISTELAFYLSFPFLLFLIKRDWKIVAGLAILLSLLIFVSAVGGLVAKTGISGTGLFYISPITRILEFMAGMLTWKAFSKTRRENPSIKISTLVEVLTIALLVFSMFLMHFLWKTNKDVLPGGLISWFATTGSFPFIALAIYVMARQGGLLSKVLSHKALVYLGEISFSVYMVHQIILRIIARDYGDVSVSNPISFYVLFWILTIGFSALLFHLIEKPCRNLARKKFSRAPQIANA